MTDGCADECHEYYCPYNIECADVEVDCDDGTIHIDNAGVYHGKPDGFDSQCPRFIAIDRANGKWDCLCGLEVVARILGVDYKELYETLKPHFDENHEILGYNPR